MSCPIPICISLPPWLSPLTFPVCLLGKKKFNNSLQSDKIHLCLVLIIIRSLIDNCLDSEKMTGCLLDFDLDSDQELLCHRCGQSNSIGWFVSISMMIMMMIVNRDAYISSDIPVLFCRNAVDLAEKEPWLTLFWRPRHSCVIDLIWLFPGGHDYRQIVSQSLMQ